MSKVKYKSKVRFDSDKNNWITDTCFYIKLSDMSLSLEDAALNTIRTIFERERFEKFCSKWLENTSDARDGYRFNISIYKESIEGYYELSPSAVALINILDADEEQPF